jgi:DNA-binding transcriptional ArsR family regulator
MVKTFVRNTSKDSLCREYIQAMNGVLRLTDAEVSVMAEILKAGRVFITADDRKVIALMIGISVPALNNHIKRLKDKGLLRLSEDGVMSVNTKAFPLDWDEDSYEVRFVFKTNG